jgi:hypothetical protein
LRSISKRSTYNWLIRLSLLRFKRFWVVEYLSSSSSGALQRTLLLFLRLSSFKHWQHLQLFSVLEWHLSEFLRREMPC